MTQPSAQGSLSPATATATKYMKVYELQRLCTHLDFQMWYCTASSPKHSAQPHHCFAVPSCLQWLSNYFRGEIKDTCLVNMFLWHYYSCHQIWIRWKQEYNGSLRAWLCSLMRAEAHLHQCQEDRWANDWHLYHIIELVSQYNKGSWSILSSPSENTLGFLLHCSMKAKVWHLE